MRIFRRRARLRALDERECYARLHGYRTGEIVLSTELAPPHPAAGPDGPTEEAPALHLVIAYPRNAGTLTGEDVRRELLRRMAARPGQAA
ncbi:MAG TPA: hypothetical protein VD769_14295 [Gaiellaceae bacterium]|nr:hypothetical protein [Gaiellaceae bacterium]